MSDATVAKGLGDLLLGRSASPAAAQQDAANTEHTD